MATMAIGIAKSIVDAAGDLIGETVNNWKIRTGH